MLLEVLQNEEFIPGLPNLLSLLNLEPNFLARIMRDIGNPKILIIAAKHLEERGVNKIAAELYYLSTTQQEDNTDALDALKKLAQQEEKTAAKPDKRNFVNKFFSPAETPITCQFYSAIANDQSNILMKLLQKNPEKYQALSKKETVHITKDTKPKTK